MKKFFAAIIAAVVIMTLFAGCGSAESSGKTLNVALISDITALDPAFAYDGPTISTMLQVTEGILRLNADGTISPQLAKVLTMYLEESLLPDSISSERSNLMMSNGISMIRSKLEYPVPKSSR